MVMASGVVSLDLDAGGWDAASLGALAAGAAVWLLVLARGELTRGPAGVAATAVLGTRLVVAGWSGVAWLLAGAAVALWAWVVPRGVVRAPASGAAFLPAVATQSLAVLAAALGGRATRPGAVFFAAGLALYVRAAIAFDVRELVRGRGDQWVAGGALAISALACARLGSGDGWRMGASSCGSAPWPGCRRSWPASSPARDSSGRPSAGRPCSRSACTRR